MESRDQVAMNILKARSNVRMSWKNDIPSIDFNSTWSEINWKKLERRLFKLQKRIYRASMRGDIKSVRRLQKTLTRSWTAKLIAVRKVTQENKGKKTAGVDGVKALKPKQRLLLAQNLSFSSKSLPTKRVWIPKPGKEEKRPLGIPTIKERAKQMLLKMALEPEWEAKFEPNSYGFRPGRCVQDAINAIQTAVNKKAKYVLDADVSQCFDKINHNELLRKVNTSPKFSRQIKAWLKSGVIDKITFQKTTEGTPQGGVISPLLANIALHGMEELLKRYIETQKIKNKSGRYLAKQHLRKTLSIIRYADDFVLIHEELKVIYKCKEIISGWLSHIGLELKPSKTRIIHTLNKYEDNQPGLNFLGFHIRNYPTGKHNSAKNTNGESLGFVTIIKPSKEAIKRHYKDIADTIDANKSTSQEGLIKALNPKVRGWANFYSKVNSGSTYRKMDNLMFNKLWKWSKRRHPNKGKTWVKNKYFKSIGNSNWNFASKTEPNPHRLTDYCDTRITRSPYLIRVKSPYDGDFIYWSKRLGRSPEIPATDAKLLKAQNGRCNICNLAFFKKDWEVDHIQSKSLGGNNSYINLQLIHKYCHDKKTKEDLNLLRSQKRYTQTSAIH